MGGAADRGRRVAGDVEGTGRRRFDHKTDAGLDGRPGDVGHGDSSAAGRLERHREGVGAVVSGQECVIGRKAGLRVGTAEMDRIAEERVGLAEGVERRHGDADRLPGRRGGRRRRDAEMRRRRVDLNARLRAGDGTVDGVGGGQ